MFKSCVKLIPESCSCIASVGRFSVRACPLDVIGVREDSAEGASLDTKCVKLPGIELLVGATDDPGLELLGCVTKTPIDGRLFILREGRLPTEWVVEYKYHF